MRSGGYYEGVAYRRHFQALTRPPTYSSLQRTLKDKNIPLIVDTYTGNRFHLPQHIANLLQTLKATHVFGNIEYEVDELRRDVQLVKLGAQGVGANKIKAVFVHDRLAVPPGLLKSGKGTPYAVYSPWQRRKAPSLILGL
jgi:deoxyribodipyrimidine photo-lyase